MKTVVMSLLFGMECMQGVENWTFWLWSWGFNMAVNCLDRYGILVEVVDGKSRALFP